MAIVTPDVETHLCERIAVVRPLDFSFVAGDARDLYPGRELPTGGQVRERATFVQLIGEISTLDCDGQWRELHCQILHRFRIAEVGARASAMARMRALYDSLHLCGEWETVDESATYHDIRALDVPFELEDRYVVLNVAVWWAS